MKTPYVDWDALAEEQRAELEDAEQASAAWLDSAWTAQAEAAARDAARVARDHNTATAAALVALLLLGVGRRAARMYAAIDTQMHRVTRRVFRDAQPLALEQARQVLGQPLWRPSHHAEPSSARMGYLDHARRQTSAATAAAANARLRDTLTQQVVGVAALTPEQAAETARAAMQGELWRARRLVVTETAFTHNAAQAGALTALATEPDLRSLRMRWTELVDDLTGRPLDRRVGDDSLELHGQLAPPGGRFIMPPDVTRKVGRLAGRSWMHPPNRPHDRAVLTPWLPGMGQPGWVWTGSHRARF